MDIHDFGRVSPFIGVNVCHSAPYLLELNTTAFMKFYREEFPRDTYRTPQDALTRGPHDGMAGHRLGRYYLGAGLMGEQSIHAHLNNLE